MRSLNPKTAFIFLGFLGGWLAVAPAQGAGYLQVIERETREGSQTLFVQAQGVSLGEVLREIANKSGIQFKVPARLMDDSVTLKIKERNWASVVHQVLRDYNGIYIWDGPTRLEHVFLLDALAETGLSLPPQITKKSYFRPNTSGEQKRNIPKGQRMDLSEDQLKKVASGAFNSPLSDQLFEDSKIKMFLEQWGIKTIKDRQKLSLARKVRRQARVILKEIKRTVMKNTIGREGFKSLPN